MKNFKKTLIKATLVVFTTTSGGCGKNPSTEDRVKDELRQSVAEKERVLTPLAGRYEGTLTRPSGEIVNIAVQLIPTIMIVQNPGRNDVTEMPTLGGNVNLYFKNEDKTDVIPIAQFTYSMYEETTGHIRLNGSIQTNSSLGVVLNTLDGYLIDQKIRGYLSNSTRGNLGLIDASKSTFEALR